MPSTSSPPFTSSSVVFLLSLSLVSPITNPLTNPLVDGRRIATTAAVQTGQLNGRVSKSSHRTGMERQGVLNASLKRYFESAFLRGTNWDYLTTLMSELRARRTQQVYWYMPLSRLINASKLGCSSHSISLSAGVSGRETDFCRHSVILQDWMLGVGAGGCIFVCKSVTEGTNATLLWGQRHSLLILLSIAVGSWRHTLWWVWCKTSLCIRTFVGPSTNGQSCLPPLSCVINKKAIWSGPERVVFAAHHWVKKQQFLWLTELEEIITTGNQQK